MSNKIKVNTHHAYLNTEIVLSSECKPAELVDQTTGISYVIKDAPLHIHLSAGEHVLRCESLKEEIIIEIEDAIKLGGSKLKKAFVFDDNSWMFVTTKDRLYALNRDTKEQKVEYNITPDEIISLGKYYQKSCEYFLMKTKSDYSIYNVLTGKQVWVKSNHIYSNSRYVIYKEDEDVVVYDYRFGMQKVKFNGPYSFGEKFFFVNGNKLYGLNLISGFNSLVPNIGPLNGNFVLRDNFLLKFSNDNSMQKQYSLFDLGNGENNIKEYIICLPFCVESFKGEKTNEYNQLKDKYDEIKKSISDLVDENKCGINLAYNALKIDDVCYEDGSDSEVLVLAGEITNFPKLSYKVPFVLKSSNSKISFDSVSIVKDDSYKKCSVESDAPVPKCLKGEELLGFSPSLNRLIVKSNGQLLYQDKKLSKSEQIFCDCFDSTYYDSAYFTNDGTGVLTVNNNHSTIFRFEDMTQKPFDIKGVTLLSYEGFNGYKPTLSYDNQQPRWRDPISMQYINPEEMSHFVFWSPDRNYYAENKFKEVYYNRFENKEISSEEHIELCRKYNIFGSDTEEIRKNKIELRKKLCAQYGETKFFKDFGKDRYGQLIRKSEVRSSYDEQNNSILELTDEDVKKQIERNDFVSLFIDVQGFVVFYKNEDETYNQILIGRNVWYLNYVSFSFDSRYLAFAAKMRQNECRSYEAGVFEIYDLLEEKIVVRKERGVRDFPLLAVWTAVFSRKGDVAYYDSTPNAFLALADSNFNDICEIKGKNFLSFSPTGKYMALSNQGYISYLSGNQNWGHQPSGNVYIHQVENLNDCIGHFNDMGEDIKGVSCRAGSVASAAFSLDEKRLLMVGVDGVIVIRNLHLENNNVE